MSACDTGPAPFFWPMDHRWIKVDSELKALLDGLYEDGVRSKVGWTPGAGTRAGTLSPLWVGD